MSDSQQQGTEDIAALVNELLSTVNQAAAVLPSRSCSSSTTPSTSRICSARYARPAASPASARPLRPSSAPARPYQQLKSTPAQQAEPPTTSSPAAVSLLVVIPAQHPSAGQASPAQGPTAGQVSRDCSLNGNSSSDTSSKLQGPSTSSSKITTASIPSAGCPAVLDRLQAAGAELQMGHAANWRAYYEQKSGKVSHGSLSCAPSGVSLPFAACYQQPKVLPASTRARSCGPGSPKAGQKEAVRKFSKGCQFPEPQTASTAAAEAAAHSCRKRWHSWKTVWLCLWLWVLAPAVIVFSTFLVVQLLPPSLYTMPSSTSCLVHGQEQVCANVLSAAVAAAVQEPPGWLLFVLRSKWFLQDSAARLLGSDAVCEGAAAALPLAATSRSGRHCGSAVHGPVQLPDAPGVPSSVAGTVQHDEGAQPKHAEHVLPRQKGACHAAAGYQPTCTAASTEDSGSHTGTHAEGQGVCQQLSGSSSAGAPAAVALADTNATTATAETQAPKTISSTCSTAVSIQGHPAALGEPAGLAQCPAQGHCPVDSRTVTVTAVHWAESRIHASAPCQQSLPGQRTIPAGWCRANALHIQQSTCWAPGSPEWEVKAPASGSKGAVKQAAQPVEVGLLLVGAAVGLSGLVMLALLPHLAAGCGHQHRGNL